MEPMGTQERETITRAPESAGSSPHETLLKFPVLCKKSMRTYLHPLYIILPNNDCCLMYL